jgi:hypothetical protein
MYKSSTKQPAPARWWQPPFSDSPDPAVRRAFAEFTTRKGNAPYSVGDVIAYMERRIPQRAGSGGSKDVYGPLGPGLARFLRELRL